MAVESAGGPLLPVACTLGATEAAQRLEFLRWDLKHVGTDWHVEIAGDDDALSAPTLGERSPS